MRKALFLAAAAAALWLAPGALASGWCGTGESATDRPDVVTGAQVHVVVATPADSPDLFAAEANELADDVDSISAWWTGQDPTRVPRYDLAIFPGGTCLDISFVRLPLPASSYTGTQAFRAVAGTLASSGFSNAYKDYVVYYDGPSVLQDVCGTGGGTLRPGRGVRGRLAERLPRPRERRDPGARAAARLRRAPARRAERLHGCDRPGRVADSGHPCDSPTDVLYPYADGLTAATEGARLQPRRLLRAQRNLDRHPGLDLPAPSRRAAGRRSTSPSPGAAS